MPPETEPTERKIGHEGLAALYRYWYVKRAGRDMPSRDDIEPTEIPSLLAHVLLLDVCHDPFGLRFRLVGSFIYEFRVLHSVRELTGRFVDEVNFNMASGDDMVRMGQDVAERRRPLLIEAPFKNKAKGVGYQKMLLLPLSSDGDAVDMLLCGLYPVTDRRRASTVLRMLEL
jgi:hypothetical protein